MTAAGLSSTAFAAAVTLHGVSRAFKLTTTGLSLGMFKYDNDHVDLD